MATYDAAAGQNHQARPGDRCRDRASANWPGRTPAPFEFLTNNRNILLVAHVDSGSGIKPHIVAIRGTYKRMFANLYDSDLNLIASWNDQMEEGTHWEANATEPSNPTAEQIWVSDYFDSGGSASVGADVDGDGQDEILLGSACLKFDNTKPEGEKLRGLWAVGGNVDCGYVAVIDWNRPGLDVWINSERYGRRSGVYAAATGVRIFAIPGSDHEGFMGDLDGSVDGLEIVTSSGDAYYADGTETTQSNLGMVGLHHHNLAA